MHPVNELDISVGKKTNASIAGVSGAVLGDQRLFLTVQALQDHCFGPQWDRQGVLFFKKAKVESIFKSCKAFVLHEFTQEAS